MRGERRGRGRWGGASLELARLFDADSDVIVLQRELPEVLEQAREVVWAHWLHCASHHLPPRGLVTPRASPRIVRARRAVSRARREVR